MKKWAILLFCLMGCIITSARERSEVVPVSAIHNPVIPDSADASVLRIFMPSDSIKADFKDTIKYRKKHRAIAALLAIPPFGLFGLHRLYMHTDPIVPFVYIVTAGGLLGVLPFIDFVLILLNKDIHLTYTSNPHLFMWQKR